MSTIHTGKKNNSRCFFLKLTVGLFFLILITPARLTAQQPPNIIFILVDDLGYGDIGVFYQNLRKQRNKKSEPWFSTPHLDKMAASGVMLTHHYSAAPVCAPSRASLITGLSQGHANIRNNQFDKALANGYTVGSMLQKAGYTTAAIGKWGLQGEGNGPDWPAHPLKRGFDYYFGYMRHKDGHEHYPKEGIYRPKTEVWENYTNVVASLDNCYTGDLWTAVAKRWITRQVETKAKLPFFLYVAFDTPHAALELPAKEYPEGAGLKGGMQWLNTPGNMITTASGKPDSWMDPAYANAVWDHDNHPLTPEQPWPETYKRYATIVSRIDKQVGDIMALLKDLQIDQNTLVVFTSDNGPSRESYLPKQFVEAEPDFFNSFGPFDGIKRDVLEGGVRVPAIVVWPKKIQPSAEMKSPSAFQDWLPTIANIAGLPAPAFSDGQSFLKTLTSGKETGLRSVYIEYFEPNKTPAYTDFDISHRNKIRKQMQLLRTGDTVAIRYDIKNGQDDFEIYDINKDPQQKNDLSKNYNLVNYQRWLKEEVVKRRMPDSSARRPYDTVLIKGLEYNSNFKKGIKYSFYKQDFKWLSSIDGLKPVKTKIVSDYSQVRLEKSEKGMVYVEGYFNAPEDGEYTFLLRDTNSFVMKINESILFNNNEGFKAEYTTQNTIMLKKGLHPYRQYFFKKEKMEVSIPVLLWEMPAQVSAKPFIGYTNAE